MLTSWGGKYQLTPRICGTNVKGLRLRLILFLPSRVGSLVVYINLLTQLCVRSCGIISTTVKVPVNLVRHRIQCLSSERSLTEALDT